MEVKLKWGHDAVAFDLPDRNVIGVLEPEGGEPVADLWEATWDLLETPTAGEPFADIVERVAPKKIAIIVNDMTRSTPTQELLPPILKKHHQKIAPLGISLVAFVSSIGRMTGRYGVES